MRADDGDGGISVEGEEGEGGDDLIKREISTVYFFQSVRHRLVILIFSV